MKLAAAAIVYPASKTANPLDSPQARASFSFGNTMKPHFLLTTLFATCLAHQAIAEDDSRANATTTEATRALLLDDVMNKAVHPVPAPAAPTAAVKSDQPAASTSSTPVPAATATAASATTTSPAATPPAPPANPSKTAKVAAEPATMLPAVEVSRSKINELNREIRDQDIAIAREKKNTKSTELDKALNDPKVSIPILGGQTTQYKTTVASERVNLMEEERDILEQMKLVKTVEEKAVLQKELDEVRTLRRDLEKNLR